MTLTDASGGLHTYAATGADPTPGRATPPLRRGRSAGRDTDGKLTLIATDGLTYVFDGAGH